MNEGPAQSVEPKPTPSAALESVRAGYREAILGGERRKALAIVQEAAAETDYLGVLVEVIAAAQAEVGALWAEGKISVAEEHLATAISQFVLAAVFDKIPLPETARGSAVICGVEGDLHQLPAQIAADALEADGWDVRFLGTELPADAVVDLVADSPPDLLGIAASMTEHAEQVTELVAAVRGRLGSRCPAVLLGGRAFEPRSASELGPGVAVAGDVREAVVLARRFAAAAADDQPAADQHRAS